LTERWIGFSRDLAISLAFSRRARIISCPWEVCSSHAQTGLIVREGNGI